MSTQPTLSISIKKPKHDTLGRPFLVLEYAHSSTKNLIDVYNAGLKRGAPKDEQMDILRSALVFAGAGMDAMLKEIIHNCMRPILRKSRDARKKFEEFVSKTIKASGEGIDPKKMAAILVNRAPRSYLIRELEYELTDHSLQSYEELMKTLAFLGVNDLKFPKKGISDAFKARNEIVHEMDIAFDAPKRNRRPRKRDLMIQHSKCILDACQKVLSRVDNLLN